MDVNKIKPTSQNRTRVIQNQIHRLEARLGMLYRRSSRLSQVRLGVFVIGAILVVASYWFSNSWVLGLISLAVWLTAFGALVFSHQQLETTILKHQIWVQMKAAQIARFNLDWAAIPPASGGRATAEHPFARDLDLTGERSLHRLLDTAVSLEGSERLQEWLFETDPTFEQVQRRQTLVKALVPLHLFRHKLRLYGLLANTGYGSWQQGDRLREWLTIDEGQQALRLILILSASLVPVNLILFVLNIIGVLPRYWIFSLAIYLGLAILRWQDVVNVFSNGLILQNSLQRLEGVFRHIEQFPLKRYPPLHDLCQPFLQPENRPSTQLKQISRLVVAVGLTQNPAIAVLFNLLVPWNLYFSYRLNAAKATIAQSLPVWLEVWFDLEAASSLAEFAYLNPDYAFPTVAASTDQDKRIFFQAKTLGHPLLPREEKVCNDFEITKRGQVSIVTGSNMAGKSSFLRTLGINLRLAYAGGPVNATHFQTIVFRLFSSLNVSDSVTDGISYFYAEVRRLKALLVALEDNHDYPLFFLIDEIFRGTNNRERYLGSQAFIRSLVDQNGSGLIATHDLELVKLADDLDAITNYHFRDSVEGGRMTFDYKLHPGPCPTTNALKIMQIEGLPFPNNQE
ncbi:MAG: hypothetical protein AAF629_34535 [Chloroflexota bacterium]